MNYKKQRNFVAKLNKTVKIEYFRNFKLGKDKTSHFGRNANLILPISTVNRILTLC